MKINWQPGIGDPSAGGWITVLAYFLAALICALAARRAHSRIADNRGSAKKDRFFWVATTILMIFLCINKQLDLQTMFTEIGRYFAHTGGWYAQRHAVQILFIFILCGFAGASGIIMLWIFRKQDISVRVASGGLCLLGAFVLVRAASFHNADKFLGESALGLRWNWILELTGIVIIAAAGASYRNAVPNAN